MEEVASTSDVITDSNMDFVLRNTNPENVTLYQEAYNYIKDSTSLGTHLNRLESVIENIDPLNVSLSIQTIFKEVLRTKIHKVGISFDVTIDLRLLTGIYSLINEIEENTDLVSLLAEYGRTEMDLSSICRTLGFEFSISLRDAILDDELFIDGLYTKHSEDIAGYISLDNTEE